MVEMVTRVMMAMVAMLRCCWLPVGCEGSQGLVALESVLWQVVTGQCWRSEKR